MDAATTDTTLKGVNELLKTANDLKVGGLIALAAVLIIGSVIFFLWLRHQRQMRNMDLATKRLEQETKDRRANAFASSTKAQANALDRLGQVIASREDESRRRHAKYHEEVITTFHGLRDVMREVRDRQRGVINSDDSLRIVEECFDHFVKHEVCVIAEQSLRRNHYHSRKHEVCTRVSEHISNVLYRARKNLSDYALSIRVDVFFQVRPGERQGSERFVIVDELWMTIERFHESASVTTAKLPAITEPYEDPASIRRRSESELQARIDGARLDIARVINDYFNACKTRALDLMGNEDPQHRLSQASGFWNSSGQPTQPK